MTAPASNPSDVAGEARDTLSAGATVGGKAAKPVTVHPYDFNRPYRISTDRMRTLEAIFEKERELFGDLLNPTKVLAHCPPILRAAGMLGQSIEQSGLLPKGLPALLYVRVATINNWFDPSGGRLAGVPNYQVRLWNDNFVPWPPHGMKSALARRVLSDLGAVENA